MNTSAVSPGRAESFATAERQDAAPLIDTSITNVALDAITHHPGQRRTAELIVALYGVALPSAWRAVSGDNYARRRLFMWGVTLFGIASLLCGMANSIGALLAGPTLRGAGAALSVTRSSDPTSPSKAPPTPGHQPVWRDQRDRAHRQSMGGGWLVSADITGLGWRNAFYQCADLPAGAR